MKVCVIAEYGMVKCVRCGRVPCNSSTWEAEARGLSPEDQPSLISEITRERHRERGRGSDGSNFRLS